MQKHYIFFIFIIINILITNNLHSDEKTSTKITIQINNDNTEVFCKTTALNHILGFTQPLLENISIWTFDKIVLDARFVQITPETIKRNLTTKWVWDQDEYYVNHLCHPYVGSIYYTSARSNNLPVWESLLAALSGSLTWELFAENELPSYNDLLITTIGGFSFGEMLYRLYFSTKNRFFATLISPITSLNSAIFHNNINNPNIDIYSLYTKLYGGIINTNTELQESNSNNKTFIPIYGGAEVCIIYGNPYGNILKTPYDQFNLNFKISGSKKYYNLTLFSQGMIYSLGLGNNENIQTTAGLSLHYDFLLSTMTNYTKNALGFTIKQQLIMPKDWNIKWDLNLNWDFIGGSDFYHIFSKVEPSFELDIPNRLYDLAYGAGIKSSFALYNPTFGSLQTFINFDYLHTIKNSLPKGGSYGFSLITIGSISYDHKIYKTFSIGLEYSIFLKNSFYKSAEDIFQNKHILNLYFKNDFI